MRALRRRLLVLLPLAAAALVLGLWGLGAGDEGDRDLHAAADADPEPAGILLHAVAPAKTARAPDGGPSLRSAAPPTPDTPRGPVEVIVVGPGGLRLPGVAVAPATDGVTADMRRTDARGHVTLRDLPYDGSVALAFYANEPWRKPDSYIPSKLAARHGSTAPVPVTGPKLVFRAQTGLWLQVDVVEAETGRAVGGARVKSRVAQRALEREGVAAPHAFFVTPRIGKRTRIPLKVTPPEGWVVWEPPSHFLDVISPYAQALSYVHPLRREMDVVVTPVETNGSVVDGALVDDVVAAGRRPGSWRFEADTYGRLRVRGVPFLRGEILKVRVRRGPKSPTVRVRTALPDHPNDTVALTAVLPDELFVGPVSNATIGIGGSGSGAFRGRAGQRDRPVYKNVVVVTVRRRGGDPAIAALVRLGGASKRTDAQGRARFTNVPPGERKVTARQMGLLPISGSVHVPESGTAQFTLREGPGGAIYLEVVDDAGRSLAYPRVRLKTRSRYPWVDMDGTRQRLDPFCDHRGQRHLRHVESGSVELTVTWGSRRWVQRVDVVSGETTFIQAVLPKPAPPR